MFISFNIKIICFLLLTDNSIPSTSRITNKRSLTLKQHEAINHLIELIKNRFEDFYKPNVQNDEIWQSISIEMQIAGCNCTAEDCLKRWNLLKVGLIKS